MYLREAQAKEIIARYGVPIPAGSVAASEQDAERVAQELSAGRYAVKALIRAGGRGLAGGVSFASTPQEAAKAAAGMLGTTLVTEQTGAKGQTVDTVYVESAIDIDRSLYLAVIVDQRTALPTVLGSTAGGVDFEKKAQANPDIVVAMALGPDGAIDGASLSGFLEQLELDGDASKSVGAAVEAMVRAFLETDAALLEINPLAITAEGAVAVDAKLVLDGNALYRHPDLEKMAEDTTAEASELVARENEINFVKMDGNIGLVVNGAGLGLATHDMVVEAGGKPANFMDIRTTATSFQIARGIGILLDDPSVDVLLVNIHGGGMTVCDTVAEAIGFAYARSERKPPIVYRAAGQNAPWSHQIMKNHRLPYEAVETMTDAVAKAVAQAGGRV